VYADCLVDMELKTEASDPDDVSESLFMHYALLQQCTWYSLAHLCLS